MVVVAFVVVTVVVVVASARSLPLYLSTVTAVTAVCEADAETVVVCEVMEEVSVT